MDTIVPAIGAAVLRQASNERSAIRGRLAASGPIAPPASAWLGGLGSG